MLRSGYLMRLAYELGYSNAVLFTRGPLQFYALDEINFKLAVPIGSILRLKSRIAHTAMGNPFLVVSFVLHT
jgi:acyl-coenzyme A thioesterase 9